MKIKLPNFTMTKGQVPEGAAAGRMRRLRRNIKQLALWGSVGVLFFILFAWLSLPTRAIAWRISHEAKMRGFIVDVEDVSISPFGGVSLENVTWTYEPSRTGEVPTKWFVEEVDVDISLIKLLWGTIDVDIEVELEEGTMVANYTQAGDETDIEIEIEELPLYGIPKMRQALNAPVTGLFALHVELNLPENEWSQAEGEISINCSACTVGDGEEKLYVPGATSMQAGLVIPQVDIGNLAGKMIVSEGVAQTEVPIETDSEDVWVFIEGKIKLKDPFQKSRFEMVLKFNISKQLQDENEPMRFMIQTAKPTSKLNPPEEGLGFRLEGPVGKPRFYGINSKSRREARADKRAKARARDARRRAKSRSRSKKPTIDANTKDDETKPTIGKPLQVEPLGDDGDKPALPPPSDEPPSTDEPAAEEPSSDEPVAEEPSSDEPAAEEPSSDEPVVEEEPAAEDGAGADGAADDGNAGDGNQDGSVAPDDPSADSSQ